MLKRIRGLSAMWLLYDLMFFLFSLAYLPLFVAKGKCGEGWRSRFGHLDLDVRRRLSGKPVVWLHAVSVGEIGLAVSFARRLRDRTPASKILITTTTLTGYEVGVKIKNDEDELLYYPIDWPWAVSRFVRDASPKMVLFFETEIWPNMLRELKRRGIPSYIVNGRISERAFRRYRWVRGFLREVLSLFTGIGAQDETMRERFIALGARPEKVTITGNLKFDADSAPVFSSGLESLRSLLKGRGEFLWIAGSTHEGEEEIVAGVYQELKAAHPELTLLIAPRHLQRIPAIEKRLGDMNCVIRRVPKGNESAPADRQGVWLLNQMGVLSSLYALADAVFLGGSLVPTGGHNPVEPARLGKAVMYGPWMTNFQWMAEQFCRADAAIQVAGPAELKKALEGLIRNERRREELGENAKRLVSRHKGATKKNMDLVLSSS